jgi:hypothetical protein
MDSTERTRILLAQKRLCKTQGSKMYMPLTGYCFHCRADLLKQEGNEPLKRRILACRACGKRC